MKKVYGICVLALAMSGALARGNNPPANPEACVEAFFGALLAKDAPALRALLTVDYAMVSFDGSLVDGPMLAEAIASGYIAIESSDVPRTYARLYGDAGIVTGTWNARGALKGYKFDNQISFMAVCVRQGGAWKMAGVQFTPIL